MKGAVLRAVEQMPWAIKPEMLDVVLDVLYRRYFGETTEVQVQGEFKNTPFQTKIEAVAITAGDWGNGGCGGLT